MYLTHVEIKNFRSIKKLTVRLEIGCQILVGINESGKSNILRALSLLGDEMSPTTRDVRVEGTSDDEPVDFSHVRFSLQLDGQEIENLYDSIKVNFDPKSLHLPFAHRNGESFTLRAFVAERSEGIYTIDCRTLGKTASYWALPKQWEIAPGWKTVDQTPAETVGVDSEGLEHDLSLLKYYNTDSYEYVTSNSSKPDADLTAINEEIGLAVTKKINHERPKCIYWHYNEQHHLPSQINSLEFASNPDHCIPLRSMFELAGYFGPKIGEIITEAKSLNSHKYAALLMRVAQKATDHLRSVWTDHKTLTIKLDRNGDMIEPIVIDESVPLDFSSRSDGFKRFVSFLLLISAKVKSDLLKDNLILVDEPEAALHPGGARSLMQELIRIGDTNRVVYSTHSIFMIDRENIGRHLIVKRESEITTVATADRSSVQDEEVLFNAIGFSMFEVLKERNVIFEGWRDKRLFEVALSEKQSKENSKSDKPKLAFGLTHAEGAKDIKNIARFFELAGRKCLIVSDNDEVSNQHKKQYEDDHGYGTWWTYAHIPSLKAYKTGEDFLEINYLITVANDFRLEQKSLPELKIEDFANCPTKFAVLERWIKAAFTDKANSQKVLHNLKSNLFGSTLTPENIVEEYKELVDAVVTAFGQ